MSMKSRCIVVGNSPNALLTIFSHVEYKDINVKYEKINFRNI